MPPDTASIDQETAAIRGGEELDLRSLTAFLRPHFENEGQIELSQFPGGSSNLTYLLNAGTREYVLRRPPFGNTIKTAHDMRREFEVLSKLSAVYPPAPRPLLFCDDENVIGSEFYLMERRHGLIIRGQSHYHLRERVGSSNVRSQSQNHLRERVGSATDGEQQNPPGNAGGSGLLTVCGHVEDAIRGADVVMILRIQRERQDSAYFPTLREYAIHYGLTNDRLGLAKKDVIVLHPGPMNRGIEISSEVADSSRSLILDQVKYGVTVRMAVLYLATGGAVVRL